MFKDLLEKYEPIIEKTKIRKNIHRTSVSGVKYYWQSKNGPIAVGNPIESQNFGLIRNVFKDRHNLVEAVQNTNHPELYEALKEIAFIINPNFEYNSITLNKNVKALKHRDTNNQSISMIIGLGDYSGGGLYLENLETGKMELIDIHYKPLLMNGYKQLHETEEFTGNRYTIIYYKAGIRPLK